MRHPPVRSYIHIAEPSARATRRGMTPSLVRIGIRNGQQLDEVRGVAAEPLALVERFVDQADVAVLEIPKAAVDELGALRRRAGGESSRLHQRGAQTSARGVERHARAGDAAADHHDVERLGSQSSSISARSNGVGGRSGGGRARRSSARKRRHRVQPTATRRGPSGFASGAAPSTGVLAFGNRTHRLDGGFRKCRSMTSIGGKLGACRGLDAASSTRRRRRRRSGQGGVRRRVACGSRASSTPCCSREKQGCGAAPPSASAVASCASAAAPPEHRAAPESTRARRRSVSCLCPITSVTRRARRRRPIAAGRPRRVAGLLTELLDGRDLTADQARAAMAAILSGQATAAQLIGVRRRAPGQGRDGRGAVGAARRRARRGRPGAARRRPALPARRHRRHGRRPHPLDQRVDDGGVGGRRCRRARVQARRPGRLVAVRHRRRARSARRRHRAAAGWRAACIDKAGFGFCFAPRFHPAFRFAAPSRREIGIPTVFNLLGPMANPGRVRRQLIGVADARFAERMLASLRVHGSTTPGSCTATGSTS